MQTEDKLFIGTLVGGALAWIPIAYCNGLLRRPGWWIAGPPLTMITAALVLVVGSCLHYFGYEAWLYIHGKYLEWRLNREMRKCRYVLYYLSADAPDADCIQALMEGRRPDLPDADALTRKSKSGVYMIFREHAPMESVYGWMRYELGKKFPNCDRNKQKQKETAMKFKCSNCNKEFFCQADRDEHERECGQTFVYLKYTMDRDSTLTETDIRITETYSGDKSPMPEVAEWSIDNRQCSVWMPENADMEKVCEILREEIVRQYPYFVLEFPLDKSSVDFGIERVIGRLHDTSVTYVFDENAVWFWYSGGEVEKCLQYAKKWLNNPYMRIWKHKNGLLSVSFHDSVDTEGEVQHGVYSDSIACRKEDAKEAYRKLKDCDTCFGIKYFRVSSYFDGLWHVEELKQPPEEGLWNVYMNRLGGYFVTVSVPSGSIDEAKQLLKEYAEKHKSEKRPKGTWRVMFDAATLEMTVAEVVNMWKQEQVYKIYTLSDGTAYMYVPKDKDAIDAAKAAIRKYVQRVLMEAKA